MSVGNIIILAVVAGTRSECVGAFCAPVNG